MNNVKQYIVTYLPGLILFAIFLIIACIIYGDYGAAWDEKTQRYFGLVNYNYAFNGSNELLRMGGRYYGAGFEMLLIRIEKFNGLTKTGDILRSRHFYSHLFFLLSCLCGYVLVYRMYKNKLIACFTFLMLAMMPRIYAHSFFNSKDIPLLSMFVVTFCFAQIAFDKKTKFWFFMAGTACGFTSSIRITGLMLPCIITSFLCCELILATLKRKQPAAILTGLLLFLSAFSLTLYACWPILWHDPLANFSSAYRQMSHFSAYKRSVLLNGQLLDPLDLPKSYIAQWLFITTPPLWLAGGIAGITLFLYHFAREPFAFFTINNHKTGALAALVIFISAITIVSVHPVLYDDWRHFYFIFPSIVFFNAYFLVAWSKTRYFFAGLLLYSVQFVLASIFMVQSHPFQEVYFNSFVSHKPQFLRKNFDLDYWAPCLKQGLESIARTDTSSKIRVASFIGGDVFDANISLLGPVERKRFEYVENGENADYFFTNFRWHPEDYDFKKNVCDLRVLNSSILCIYKLKQ